MVSRRMKSAEGSVCSYLSTTSGVIGVTRDESWATAVLATNATRQAREVFIGAKAYVPRTEHATAVRFCTCGAQRHGSPWLYLQRPLLPGVPARTNRTQSRAESTL